MRFHTILFDLDGTLTDSREGIFNCIRYALDKMQLPVPEESVLLQFIGPPLQDSFSRCCGMSERDALRAVELFQERYAPVGKFENAAAPGMVELCRKLYEHGLTLAVASSKPESMCRPICERFGFAPFMRIITGSPPGEEWGKARVIQEVLTRLHTMDKSGVLMVGDRKYDVEGALANGLTCAGVEFFGYAEPGELQRAGATVVVHSAAELEHFILDTE